MMEKSRSYILALFITAIGLASCSSSVTLYKAKHPKDASIYDAWIKYNKETINPACRHDYIRGTIIGTDSQSLTGVEVKVDGHSAYSEIDGKFYLIIPDDFNINKRVRFEFPGFRDIQIPSRQVTCRELVVRMHEVVKAK